MRMKNSERQYWVSSVAIAGTIFVLVLLVMWPGPWTMEAAGYIFGLAVFVLAGAYVLGKYTQKQIKKESQKLYQ